jgi:hypothetical protein
VDVEAVFESSIRRDLIRRIRIQLLVGDADVVHGGSEFSAWPRQMQKARGVDGRRDAERKLEGR